MEVKTAVDVLSASVKPEVCGVYEEADDTVNGHPMYVCSEDTEFIMFFGRRDARSKSHPVGWFIGKSFPVARSGST